MKVHFKGKIIGTNSYHSEKKGKDIFEFDVYDGKDLVRVTGVPQDIFYSAATDGIFDYAVRVYNGSRGLYVVFDNGYSEFDVEI